MSSINLSIIAAISSLILTEIFAACFSCSNNSNQFHNSLGLDDENFVFDIPEAEIIKHGDLSDPIRDLSRVDFLPGAFTSK